MHFPLAVFPVLRNLSIMRQLLLAFGLLSIGIFPVSAEDTQALTTNFVSVGKQGTLQILTPNDWKFTRTERPGSPSYASLHAPSNSIAIEISLYWDGLGKKISKPTQADFERIVSNTCASSFEANSVEKKIVLEKLQGASVSGTFARFTDPRWVPMLKSDFPNVASGMFRCGNLWGNFNLLTYDKDGPLFKQGLQVLQSMRSVP
jgi:hypothetical protein